MRNIYMKKTLIYLKKTFVVMLFASLIFLGLLFFALNREVYDIAIICQTMTAVFLSVSLLCIIQYKALRTFSDEQSESENE